MQGGDDAALSQLTVDTCFCGSTGGCNVTLLAYFAMNFSESRHCCFIANSIGENKQIVAISTSRRPQKHLSVICSDNNKNKQDTKVSVQH